jgi:hypothetical protein
VTRAIVVGLAVALLAAAGRTHDGDPPGQLSSVTAPPALAVRIADEGPRSVQAFDLPASGSRSPRNASYDIDVRLGHRARTLRGRQTLRWRNISSHGHGTGPRGVDPDVHLLAGVRQFETLYAATPAGPQRRE